MCSLFSRDADRLWQGPRRGRGTLCPSWEVTHQGSRNTVATLNPIKMHIVMKSGRLLGTQATIITAGMKSWEGHTQASQVRGRREKKVLQLKWFCWSLIVFSLRARWRPWPFSLISAELTATEEPLPRLKPVWKILKQPQFNSKTLIVFVQILH